MCGTVVLFGDRLHAAYQSRQMRCRGSLEKNPLRPNLQLTSLPQYGECIWLPAAPSTRRMSDEPPEDDVGLTVREAIIAALTLIGGCMLLVAAIMWLTQP